MARIRRVAGPATLSGVATTRYTVATGMRAVIRHIHFSNPTGSPVTVTMSINGDTPSGRIFDGFSIAANTVYDHYCAYQLAASETIQAFASTPTVIVLTIDAEEEII